MSINELSVAQAVAEGVLPSPTVWLNASYVSLRLSGTGVAFRRSAGPNGEFVFRDKADWCSVSMLRRALGLPCVVEHPSTGSLTSTSFALTCVGYIIYSYVHPIEDAPWGILRCLDANAAKLIAEGVFDTSPGVIIAPENCATIEVEGRTLLVEGPPLLWDHVALVDHTDGNRGVWTRCGDTPGVEVTEQVEQH
jgi:hypothetical protein